MANSLAKQIIEEGWRNAVVKLTGVLDSSDAVETPAIALSDFSNNDPHMTTLIGLRIDRLEYSIGQGIEVQLEWNANTPQQMVPLAGRGRVDTAHYSGWQPDQNRSGYNGNINLRTTGWGLAGASTHQNFTIILEMVKLYTT